MPAVRPAIYVATLNDYNNGILHGAWIDSTLPAAAIELAIAEIVATSPTTLKTGEPAEDWAILDHEGFGEPIDPAETIDGVVDAAQQDLPDARALSLVRGKAMGSTHKL